MIAYTIVSRAYVPHARVLARSYARSNPGSELWALLIDDLDEEVNEDNEPFRVLRLANLDIEIDEVHTMAMLFGGRLIAAIKPWVFEYFLQQGAESVLYLDSDFVVYDTLDECAEAARTHGVLVVPHVLTPMPRDGRKPDETMVLGVGTFNAGMFGVGLGHGGFINFLKMRLRRECRTDIKAMRVNEQRWLDFVPPLFPHHVLRDFGVDVAPWNIHERPLSRDGDRILAAEVPLRAFHFSGFDPRVPSVLSARDYWVSPRVAVTDEPVLHDVVEQYRNWLLEAGFEDSCRIPFAFDFLPDGRPIPASLRALYAEALQAAEQSGGFDPPDPYDVNESPEFEEWYRDRYAAAGVRVPSTLDRARPVRARDVVPVGAAMTLGDAGRRNTAGIIESDPNKVGFVGFCPRLLLDAGRYRFIIDVAPVGSASAPDEEPWDSGLVVDLAIDGQVLACREMLGVTGGLFHFEADIPVALRAPALSAGVDVRFFTHGGVGICLQDVLMEYLPPGKGLPPDVNWICEMLMADGCWRDGATIRQGSERYGLMATGPHWRLAAGRYRAELGLRADTVSDDEETVVCHVEILAGGRPVAMKQLHPRDLVAGTTSLEFDVTGPVGAPVEFRVRGEGRTALTVGPLYVEVLGPTTATSADFFTDWLPALWLSESGRRKGAEVQSVPDQAGVMTVGPHWKLDPGRYSLVAKIVADVGANSTGSNVAAIEVLVDGVTSASLSIDLDLEQEAAMLLDGFVREYAMEFDIRGPAEEADVELRIMTTGVVPLSIRSLRVLALSSQPTGAS